MNGAPFRCAARRRYFINFSLENASAVGEEKNIVVRFCSEELGDEIFFANIRADKSLASALLRFEGIWRKPLYISTYRKCNYGFFLGNQIFVAESFYSPVTTAVFLSPPYFSLSSLTSFFMIFTIFTGLLSISSSSFISSSFSLSSSSIFFLSSAASV